MALNKKRSRPITADGAEYRWMIGWPRSEYTGKVQIIVAPVESNGQRLVSRRGQV